MFYFKATIGFLLSLVYQIPRGYLQLNKKQEEKGVGQKFVISHFYKEGGGRNGKIKDRKAKVSFLGKYD